MSPRTTFCGHAFCEKCISPLIISMNSQCPICRAKINRTLNVPSLLLNKIASSIANEGEPHIKKDFEARVAENEREKEERAVTNFTVDMKLDVLDTEQIWCVGVVKQIFANPAHGSTLLIHYKGWDPMYDEFICERSSRLARLGYYTDREGIPQYVVPFMEENNARTSAIIMRGVARQSFFRPLNFTMIGPFRDFMRFNEDNDEQR